MAKREVVSVSSGRRTVDGAGVKLTRIFSNNEASRLDPFLLLDQFGSKNPEDYLAGFPWHPHRGIETVTYQIRGEVEHGDNLGNRGVIRSGDIQWMTAGSGIIHQEMPKRYEGESLGFQLWVNLPSKKKMCEPKYRGLEAKDLKPVEVSKGVKAIVIAGKAGGKAGPVKDIAVEISYIDFSLEPGARLLQKTDEAHTAFAYLFEGVAKFGNVRAAAPALVLFGKGVGVEATAEGIGARFMLATGKPIGEPIAWGGPIVMNTEKELALAFEELGNGTFIKQRKKVSRKRPVDPTFISRTSETV